MALTKIDDRGVTYPLDLLDNEKIRFGTGNDLELYHDGTRSWVRDSGSGNLIIDTDGSEIDINSGGNAEYMARFIKDGAVELFYDNKKSFETRTDGVSIKNDNTETFRFTGNILSGVSDSAKIYMGAGDDLQIYHDGANSYINDTSTGELYIQGDSFIGIRAYGTGENMAKFIKDGAVELYWNNAKKLETKEKGIAIQSGQRECNITLQNDARTWKIVNYDYTDAGADNLGFHDGTADRFIIKNNGNVQIPDGDLEVASGHGIDFSANSHASGMSSETLDSYEEGTWTPVVNSGTISGGGYYTRIGNVVTVQMYDTALGGTRTSAVLEISGLPFIPAKWTPGPMYAAIYNSEATSIASIAAQEGYANLKVVEWGNEAIGTDFGNGYFVAQCTYRIA